MVAMSTHLQRCPILISATFAAVLAHVILNIGRYFRRRAFFRAMLLVMGLMASSHALALYDPKPSELISPAVGTWIGTLTYRDYKNPDKMVTLPARMVVTLASPNELALYYVFDDGPGKTVYSYERMTFEFDPNKLQWISGTAKPTKSEYRITSAKRDDGKTNIAFERSVEARIDRFAFDLTERGWSLTKTEVQASGAESIRSKYEFKRQ